MIESVIDYTPTPIYVVECSGCGRRFTLRKGDSLNVQFVNTGGRSRSRCLSHDVIRGRDMTIEKGTSNDL